MAESSDPCLFTRRAQKNTGPAAVNGVVMITKSKVTWQPNDPEKGQMAVLDISAITRTQQAPGKPFIKLDAATGALVLGFESVGDRDEAVELLKQLKPPAGAASGSTGASAATGAASKGSPAGGSAAAAGGGGGKLLLPSAQQAAALFKSDPDLGSLYTALVTAGILSEAEFWRTRQGLLRGGGGSGSGGGGGGGPPQRAQRVGLPSAMLADVKPSADGQTEKVHFQLTPQIIQQIFTERPEVHRAYLAHVPHNLDEKAFWTRYFKQQYKRMARRRRQGFSADAGDDDEDELFAPFRKQLQEQEQQRAKLEIRGVDPTVNLAADAGEHFSSTGFLGTSREGARESEAAQRQSHLGSIARDINRHAAVVLEGAPEGLAGLADDGSGRGQEGVAADTGKIATALAAQQKAAAKAAAARAGASGGGGSGRGAQGEGVSKERLAEWQERAASALEDLRLDDQDSRYLPLNIQDPRAYFDAGAGAAGEPGGVPSMPSTTAARAAAAAAADGSAAGLVAALAAVRPLALPNPPCDPALALDVLLELSQEQDASVVEEFGPVAASALQYPPQDRTRGVPPLLLEHLRGEALKANELLRHYWGNLPLVSTPRWERADKLARALADERTLLLSHMRHPAGEGSGHQVHIAMMLRPLVAAIDAALARHQAEQQQRRKAPP